MSLLIAALLVFTPNLGSFFLADDFVLLSWTHVHTPEAVLDFFSPYTWWFYRPLVKLLYWLSQSLFGFQTLPLHLFSIICHGANAFLVYYLLVRQLGIPWATGLTASLLFLLNAHHAETVSWIAASGELIATGCILGALICFQRFCASRNAGYWLASLGLFLCALLARESGILLPGVLLLDALLFARTARWPWRKRLLVAGSYGAVALGYVALQLIGRTATGPTGVRGGLEFHALSFDSVLLGILDYVHGLIPGGSFIAQLPLETLRILLWFEWLVIGILAVLLWHAGRRVFLYGLGWLLLTPVLFIFFSTPTDRYFYLPSVGYSILVAVALTEFPRLVARWRPPAIANARLLMAGALTVLLLAQTHDLLVRLETWTANAQTSASVIHNMRQAVPDPRNYAAFYFVDVPAWRNGVPLFLDGLPQAVQLAYGDNRTLLGVALSCADLQRESLPRYSFFFQYTEDGIIALPDRLACR